MDIIHIVRNSGYFGWAVITLALVGLVLTAVVGRRLKRPGSVAAAGSWDRFDGIPVPSWSHQAER